MSFEPDFLYVKGHEKLKQLLAPVLVSPKIILNLGSFLDAKFLVKKFSGTKVITLAYNLQVAKKPFLGFRQKNLVCAHFTALPFRNGTFDFIWSNFSLLNLKKDEFNLAVGELARVLKPNCPLFITTLGEFTRESLESLVDARILASLPSAQELIEAFSPNADGLVIERDVLKLRYESADRLNRDLKAIFAKDIPLVKQMELKLELLSLHGWRKSPHSQGVIKFYQSTR